MNKTPVERIAILETRVDADQLTLRDIDKKLDNLPKMIGDVIETATERCREMQAAKCGLMQKQMQPEAKPKSNITGWVSAITVGIISGVGLATKTLNWW